MSMLETEQAIELGCETTTKLQILECCYTERIELALILENPSEPDETLQTIEFIRNELPEVKIVILSPHAEDEKEIILMQAGVNGVIGYSDYNIDIPLALHSVMKGELWFRREVFNNYVKLQITKTNDDIDKSNDPLNVLTFREKHIMAYAYQGYTNKEIGVKLKIAETIVKNYLYKIYKKLNIKNRKQLRAFKL